MENLEEFRFYFTSEDQIDTWVTQIQVLKEGDNAELRVQIARVRRAWADVRRVALKREARKTTAAAAELDDLLEEDTLRDAKVGFCKRYKMKYPAEIMPSDALISRSFKQIERRLLSVTNI